MQISFHTDAFCSAFWTFEKCLDWAQKNDVHHIECGLIDGVSWMHGLGYLPHLSVIDDPLLLRKKMEKYNVRFSQIDAAFPLSGKEGQLYGVAYVMNAIRYAKLVGCPRVCTTDGLLKPEGLEDEEAMVLMKRSYEQIIQVAEAYEIDVTIEIHGYFTTNIERLAEMLNFVESSRLRLNLDTGNSFISGGNPIDFANRFAKKTSHVHIKDVSRELAEKCRGNDTGIALSHVAIGDGVNADNIRQTLAILHQAGFNGPISMECEGQGGLLIERSLVWIRKTLKELGIQAE
ncbi:MAG: sugar phosphate isomerase/epimerase [Planctomycetaceae bacterium]|jgi:sugar phosphate isomerase/epimerase|nr:sugar phosphate isomerase/epimerase [Planctomycetaceae bacterium]